MTFEGLKRCLKMTDMFARKCPLVSIGVRAEGLECADQGARTPIGASGILLKTFSIMVATLLYRGFSIHSRKVFRSFSKRIGVPGKNVNL
jgi:hypothetical protein